MSSGLQIVDLKAELDDKPVYQVILSNAKATVSLFSFGATLQSFVVDLPGFKKRDLILGYPDWTSYQHTFDFSGNAYMGAIIGPVAGRIANARIPWKADSWTFDPNEGPHLLHGGPQSFSNHNWTLKETKDTPYPTVTFELQEKEKFNLPGMLHCLVSYTLTNTALEIDIKSRALEDTIVNPTQHCYFNPNGHQGSVLDAQAFICTAAYLELNQEKLPTGAIKSIQESKAIDQPIALSDFHLYPQLDTAFVLNKDKQQAHLVAADGLQLTFSTNQPLLQVYIGGEVSWKGKEEQVYHRYSGICLEQQAEPDAPNQANFSDIYLSKGQTKVNSLQIQFEQ
jgi:aldose 1-epimerase